MQVKKFYFKIGGFMKFKEGKRYEITRLDVDARKNGRKYKAKFDYMTDNLIFFDNGLYKIAEIKSNYRRTWKVRTI